jgi:hypothetical protein
MLVGKPMLKLRHEAGDPANHYQVYSGEVRIGTIYNTSGNPTGNQHRRALEVTVDGKPRTYDHKRELAIEAAQYLKHKNPHADVTVLATSPKSRRGHPRGRARTITVRRAGARSTGSGRSS